jgi:hypothetical protein
VQPVDVFSLGVGGVLVESRCLADGFGQVFHEVADVTASFLAATQDALDMDLFAEADDVGGFGQLLAGLFSVCSGVPVAGSVKALARGSHTGSRSAR